jgi:hypothetical protein
MSELMYQYFTFQISKKYNETRTQKIDNYETGYWISFPYGNYRRYSLNKINKDVSNFKDLSVTHIKEINKDICSINKSSLFKRRSLKNNK